MNDSVSNPEPALAAPPGAGDSRAYRLRIEFTGSGSEYFRIWIVNLLLLLVTFGIYFPWAKVRRLRYFYGNTLVDGEPLDFHGNPLKMLKGYLMVGLLFVLYSIAGNFSATAGLIAFVIVMAIWPALLKSSMQFRMANTSWRGLRFSFRGSLGDAYRAVLPMFIPGLVILAAVTGVADPEKPPNWYLFTVLGVALVGVAVAPWLMWNLKQYQHNHYAMASLQTSFRATLGSFYKVVFKTLGVMLLAALLTAAVFAAIFFAVKPSGPVGRASAGVAVFVAIFGFVASAIAMLVVVKPYVVSRMQNLVWTQTGNASLRFLSKLSFRSMLGLSVKNWLLVIVTLGLYWPFAAVALARMRLEAVTVKSRVSPDALVSQMRAVEGDAAGDAAGDVFGIDIGF